MAASIVHHTERRTWAAFSNYLWRSVASKALALCLMFAFLLNVDPVVDIILRVVGIGSTVLSEDQYLRRLYIGLGIWVSTYLLAALILLYGMLVSFQEWIYLTRKTSELTERIWRTIWAIARAFQPTMFLTSAGPEDAGLASYTGQTVNASWYLQSIQGFAQAKENSLTQTQTLIGMAHTSLKPSIGPEPPSTTSETRATTIKQEFDTQREGSRSHADDHEGVQNSANQELREKDCSRALPCQARAALSQSQSNTRGVRHDFRSGSGNTAVPVSKASLTQCTDDGQVRVCDTVQVFKASREEVNELILKLDAERARTTVLQSACQKYTQDLVKANGQVQSTDDRLAKTIEQLKFLTGRYTEQGAQLKLFEKRFTSKQVELEDTAKRLCLEEAKVEATSTQLSTEKSQAQVLRKELGDRLSELTSVQNAQQESEAESQDARREVARREQRLRELQEASHRSSLETEQVLQRFRAGMLQPATNWYRHCWSGRPKQLPVIVYFPPFKYTQGFEGNLGAFRLSVTGSRHSTVAISEVTVESRPATYHVDFVHENFPALLGNLLSSLYASLMMEKNFCLCVDGKTGVGKSHLMFNMRSGNNVVSPSGGLVAQLSAYILDAFRALYNRQASKLVYVNISCLEFYRGEIFDLVDAKQSGCRKARRLIKRADSNRPEWHLSAQVTKQPIIVTGEHSSTQRSRSATPQHFSPDPSAATSIQMGIDQILEVRQTSSTPYNDSSSRGHLVINIELSDCEDGSGRSFVMRFVDLAGNETLFDSNVDGATQLPRPKDNPQGRETKAINLSRLRFLQSLREQIVPSDNAQLPRYLSQHVTRDAPLTYLALVSAEGTEAPGARRTLHEAAMLTSTGKDTPD